GSGTDSADAPVTQAGRRRGLSLEGALSDPAYPPPAAGWRYLRRRKAIVGYAFDGTGAVRAVLVKAGKLVSVAGRGTGLGHTLAANPAPVRVVLTLGAEQSCTSYGRTPQFTARATYVATDARALEASPRPYRHYESEPCR